MNKLAMTFAARIVQDGVLIVSRRELHMQSKERSRQIVELSARLTWANRTIEVGQGVLAVAIMGHDDVIGLADLPYLPMGDDGRAAGGRVKRA